MRMVSDEGQDAAARSVRLSRSAETALYLGLGGWMLFLAGVGVAYVLIWAGILCVVLGALFGVIGIVR